nr:MAG TPA: hypothetical protein [Caudoviricetes sp.]
MCISKVYTFETLKCTLTWHKSVHFEDMKVYTLAQQKCTLWYH